MPEYSQLASRILGNPFEMSGRNIVNVAEGENVALVEIGAGVVAFQVVGVHEIDILPVGLVIERMGVGVSHGQSERSDGAADGHLQRIVIELARYSLPVMSPKPRKFGRTRLGSMLPQAMLKFFCTLIAAVW